MLVDFDEREQAAQLPPTLPPAHSRWLADHPPTCTPHLVPDDGHLTLLLRRPAEILRDLAAALR